MKIESKVIQILDTAPTFLDAAGYESLAATAREKKFPQLAAFWERRAHQAQVNAERDLLSAREHIAEARLKAELEYHAMAELERSMDRRS